MSRKDPAIIRLRGNLHKKSITMDNDQPSGHFYRSLMTGVFTGFAVTILCLVYNLVYRGRTDFIPADIINVSSLIFGINSFFVLAGLAYALFAATGKGDLIHMVVFAALTLFCVWRAQSAAIFDNPVTNAEFKSLLTAILLIIGISASFVMPFLFHNKTFEKDVI
jgi:hypothetical protein